MRRVWSDILQIYDISNIKLMLPVSCYHDDVIRWKEFSRHWPFVLGIQRSPVKSPNKGQRRGALMFFFAMRLIRRLSKHRYAGDLRPHCAHYNVTAMFLWTRLYRRRFRGSKIVQNQPCHTYRQDCYKMVSHLNCSGPYSESHRKFYRIITRSLLMN